ncbi:type IV pilin protein [Alteromonas lipolytica]|uniref:Type IV pilin n=1 Tax=Alteromonas lipolytica TaxID=1856405 RepID=A0A1E8F9D3_9ALTE|nr:type IV pilin protein [Alteromonas lipolytica]OFI32531.1 hypothetical protein BFC17_05055 [Alteromonas lipolytica]GGF75334.1 type IV pilin [Alteromonas lipolytica]
MMQRCKLNQGFTLIEMMIAIVIMGILAAVAVPSYQSQVRESRRGDGQTALMQMHMSQENYRLQNVTYGSANDIAIPASDFYTFTVSNVSATTFTLTATAKNSQTSDTGCTTLTLNQSLTRTPAGCW